MKTIDGLRTDLESFKNQAKSLATSATSKEEALKQIQQAWLHIFDCTLDKESAEGFVAQFRGTEEMMKKKEKKTRRRNRKQSGGGGITGAPVAYQMGPGVPSAQTYGHFTTDVSKDAQSQHDLDVYYNSGMSRTAGTELWRFPTVPAGMGSNKVGGARSSRKKVRKQKGGAAPTLSQMMSNISQMPMVATIPPSSVNTAYASWSGLPSAPSSDPTAHSWKYQSTGTGIDPANVTKIGADISKLAATPAWKS
jgi:hypothetical protein